MEHTFEFSTFKKSVEEMVAKNDLAWNGYGRYSTNSEKIKDYSLEEVKRIIESGNLIEQQKLSHNYFIRDGFYKRLIYYYGTLLKYAGILIPNAYNSQKLKNASIQKRYKNAIDFLDEQDLPVFFAKVSICVLTRGAYYGVISTLNKKKMTIIDLPSNYCRTNYVDLQGNDIIEFDVGYFNTIYIEEVRKNVLELYPKEISRYYKKYKEGKVSSPWMIIPSEYGVCFSFVDANPILLSVIPSTIQYDDAVETERERDAEEIRKIIVQKIPHLTDGQLLFEPEEAAVMHSGTVGMMKGNKNVSVLTTYADVDAIVSKSSADSASNNLEKMMQNIYYEASASSQIFSPTGNLAIGTSIKNDIAFMMFLVNKYSKFMTKVVNTLFSNGNISFKYIFLPISYYNEEDYINNTFKLAQSGYSFVLPAIAVGLSQRDLGNIKELENDVLELGSKLIPLQSSYTQSGSGEVGAPEKSLEDKAPKTIQNEESIDNTGGGK